MENAQKKILVTGGAGYIGSHTVVKLQAQGFSVIIADDLSNSRIEVLDGITAITGIRPIFEQTDLSDAEATRMLFDRHPNISAIIHFAALKAVGESTEKPLAYYKNNLFSLVNLLENVQRHQIQYFIFSSSCTVYGTPEQLPVTESTPIQAAASPYGNTKQIGEEIIQDACTAGEIANAISLRYFNPVGAHPSARIGELPLGTPNNLMPFITQTAAGLRSSLQVFGNDYNTPDGTAIRDYIHVEDLAAAHLCALEYLENGKNKVAYEVFNLGTGKGYSVLEVIRSFEKVSGRTLPFHFAPRRKGDVESVFANPDKAREVLGWQAHLGLDDMTLSAWKWEQAISK